MKNPLKELTIELKPTPMLPGEIGMFAARDIRKGEKIAPSETVEDDFLTHAEFMRLSPALQEKVRAFTASRPGGFLIEANVDFNELPVSHWANHSCEGNMGFDDDGDFIALRDVKRGEELQYDYGLVEAGSDFFLECKCGTDSCRKKVTGNDYRDPKFRARMGAYIYPELKTLVP